LPEGRSTASRSIIKTQVRQSCGPRDGRVALRGRPLRKEFDEEQLIIKNDPGSRVSRLRQGLAPALGEPELEMRRHGALSRHVLTDARKAPKSILQRR